jgi:hypothetical protein
MIIQVQDYYTEFAFSFYHVRRIEEFLGLVEYVAIQKHVNIHSYDRFFLIDRCNVICTKL